MRRLALVAMLTACAHPAPHLEAPAKASAPLHLTPLTDLVPAAGLRWILEVQPRALLGDPAVIAALPTLFPEKDLDAMARARGGVDLRSTTSLVVAEYPTSTLYLAAQVIDPPRLEAAFTAHAAEVFGRAVDVPSDDPREALLRLWGGSGKEHESLVVFGREGVGLCVGADSPLRASEGFATGRLKRAHPAWKSAPLDQLAEYLGNAHIRAGAPGPFVGEWALGLGGLLGAASAVGAAASLDGDTIRIHGVLLGPWGDRATEAGERVEKAYAALTSSGMGRLLGLDRPASPPSFAATPQSVTVDAHIPLPPLVRGLRDATSAGVDELMRGLK